MWGFICGDYWYSIANRNVACRQLGFSNSNCKFNAHSNYYSVFNYSSFKGHAYSQYSFFGGSQDTAPLVWDRFNCIGSETSLTQCSKYNYGYRSTCTYTAGIYCPGQNIATILNTS